MSFHLTCYFNICQNSMRWIVERQRFEQNSVSFVGLQILLLRFWHRDVGKLRRYLSIKKSFSCPLILILSILDIWSQWKENRHFTRKTWKTVAFRSTIWEIPTQRMWSNVWRSWIFRPNSLDIDRQSRN